MATATATKAETKTEPCPGTNWPAVARDLRAIVDPQFVIEDRETLRPYECDGLSMYRELPRLVVLPDTVEQVQAVLVQVSPGG